MYVNGYIFHITILCSGKIIIIGVFTRRVSHSQSSKVHLLLLRWFLLYRSPSYPRLIQWQRYAH
jgi:hypothetical protein